MYCVVDPRTDRAYYGTKVEIAEALTNYKLTPIPNQPDKFQLSYKFPGKIRISSVSYSFVEWRPDEMYKDAASIIFTKLKEHNYLIFRN
jgi:hypothetical protein